LERCASAHPALSGALAGSTAYEKDNIILIVARNSFSLNNIKKSENAAKLREIALQVTGKPYAIKAKSASGGQSEDPCAGAEPPPETAREGELKTRSGVETLLNKAAQNNIPVVIKETEA
jgi:hypothetical protein